MKVKAIVLFSGGLDSRLVIKILKEQKINLIALHFILPFGTGCCVETTCVFNFAQIEDVPIKFIDCTKGKNFRDYLKIIKNPKFGYGAGINPCIDCRIFMLKKAKKIMKEIGADFIATGEVLGERPMSQNLRALKLIEKEVGLTGKILRPLSAKLLKETWVEKKGLVNREKLCAISGRRRLPQMELAKKFEFKNYPSPAGGCLLCDKEFTKRFKMMLENFGDINENDAEILKIGRHFWSNKNLIVVGRNHEENLKIKELAQKNDILLELKDIPGPTTLIRMGAFVRMCLFGKAFGYRYSGAKISKKTISEAKRLTKKYSKKAGNKRKITFKILTK